MSLPDVVTWAESHWIIPETGRLIVLAPWERQALHAMFPPGGSPSAWQTFLISAPKKAGKTTMNAIATTYGVLDSTIRERRPETAFVVANDMAQAQERVFDIIVAALRSMGWEKRGLVSISRTEIVFSDTGSRIVAIPADFAGAAGAIFGISSWTETWAFRFEDHVRLFEELTPIPGRRSLRIVDSYAGFTGDAPILEPMWQRALAGERLDERLPIYANGKLWAFLATGEEGQRLVWRGTVEEADEYYREQAATLRPGTFARLHLNQWQSGAEQFLTAQDWDRCVIEEHVPMMPSKDAELFVGVDAATKDDCAAVVAIARDGDRYRLARHRIWRGSKQDPLDLEETVERFLLELHAGYRVRAVYFDPYAMQRSEKTLSKAGLGKVLHEVAQTSGNLTAAGQGLYELVRSRSLVMYPDMQLREHALNAVAVDSGRGWRIAKEKSTRKVDGLVALSFAALAAVERGSRRSGGGVSGAIVMRHGRIVEPELEAGEISRFGRAWLKVGEGPAVELTEEERVARGRRIKLETGWEDPRYR